MKKFQMIMDFYSNKLSELGTINVNDKCQVSMILRNGRESIDLTGKKINVFMQLENGMEQCYTNSSVVIINPEKGLMQFIIDGTQLFSGRYEGELEILDKKDNSYITSNPFTFVVNPVLNNRNRIDTYVNIRKIETLQQLDLYVEEAIEKLKQLDALMKRRGFNDK